MELILGKQLRGLSHAFCRPVFAIFPDKVPHFALFQVGPKTAECVDALLIIVLGRGLDLGVARQSLAKNCQRFTERPLAAPRCSATCRSAVCDAFSPRRPDGAWRRPAHRSGDFCGCEHPGPESGKNKCCSGGWRIRFANGVFCQSLGFCLSILGLVGGLSCRPVSESRS